MTEKNGAFRLYYVPPGSAEGNMLHELPYAITIKPFEGDWFDAANIYRNWAVPNASWLKKGKLSERKDIPDWAFNVTTWLNPGNTDNAYRESLDGIITIAKRLNLDKNMLSVLAYEWDYLGRK